MTEPLWGAHPHFAQFGTDTIFNELLQRCGDRLDVIEVFFDGSRGHRMQLSRNPDFTRPDDVPAGMVWMPNPNRRQALITLDEADPDSAFREAIQQLISAMPYRDAGECWPHGTPSMEFGRDGASLKMPIQDGSLVIYSEGREKTLAPGKPFWTSMVSVYHQRRYVPDSDIVAAGGHEAYVLERLLDDPCLNTPHNVVPLDERRFTSGPLCIHLPLDTYVQETIP